MDQKTAQKILEWASHNRFEDIIIQQAAEALNLDYQEVYRCCKSLEGERRGRLVIGRRGRQTRFVFSGAGADLEKDNLNKESKNYSDDASGSAGQGTHAGEPTAETLNHPFLLRPGFETKIALPADLKPNEAERLASFIRTLPFTP